MWRKSEEHPENLPVWFWIGLLVLHACLLGTRVDKTHLHTTKLTAHLHLGLYCAPPMCHVHKLGCPSNGKIIYLVTVMNPLTLMNVLVR